MSGNSKTPSSGQIDVGDLPEELVDPDASPLPTAIFLPESGLDLPALVSSIERELIGRSLERARGNKGQAARLLNLKRTTFVEKLKRLHK
jgi:transcriptional regulator of acetoin/glycerol metabolism